MNTKTNHREALENLFEFVSPRQLKTNLTEVFFGYLMQVEDGVRDDFKEIVEDMYLLLECLEKMDDDLSS